MLRGLLPGVLKAKVPPPAPAGAHRWPQRVHPRKVLLLLGCVQPAMAPNINSATARVLDAAGIQTLVAEDAGCCGAIHLHGGDHEGALEHMRRNIDAWWPLVSTGGVEAIVMNASGCGVTVKEYGHSLRHDPAYADKAEPHRRPDPRPFRDRRGLGLDASGRDRSPSPLPRRAGEG